jgi:steroid delta-isomerase-like uncharacterized protein
MAALSCSTIHSTETPFVVEEISVEPARMDELIDRHIHAELAGDFEGAVATYTEDVVHDFVGAPEPAIGRAAAKQVYINLDQAMVTEEMELVRQYHGTDFCLTEHRVTAAVKGPFPGVPPDAKRVTARLLHLFEFRDGLISRENVWAGPFTPVDQ